MKDRKYSKIVILSIFYFFLKFRNKVMTFLTLNEKETKKSNYVFIKNRILFIFCDIFLYFIFNVQY